MDSGDPQTAHAASAGRKAWLILRVWAILLLGVWISYVSFIHYSVIGRMLGCLAILAAIGLTYSKGAGFRYRFISDKR